MSGLYQLNAFKMSFPLVVFALSWIYTSSPPSPSQEELASWSRHDLEHDWHSQVVGCAFFCRKWQWHNSCWSFGAVLWKANLSSWDSSFHHQTYSPLHFSISNLFLDIYELVGQLDLSLQGEFKQYLLANQKNPTPLDVVPVVGLLSSKQSHQII